MNCYILYATETRCEAAKLAEEVNFAVRAAVARVARPEPGILKKPYRYLVLTTSETAAGNRDLLRVVRAGIDSPRSPKLQLAKEWFSDALTGSIETLTRLTRKLKGETA